MNRFATPPRSAHLSPNHHDGKLDASPSFLTPVKAHLRQTRPRLDTASTMVPCSTDFSFAASPLVSPRASCEAPAFFPEPVPIENFMLPDTGMFGSELKGAEALTMTTPRAKPIRATSPAGCSTPQSKAPVRSADTPPPRARSGHGIGIPGKPQSRPPQNELYRALKKNSEAEVLSALQQQPNAAKEPLWEHDCEPPLCCAVRFQCSVLIVKLLLDYGADRTEKDRRGNTPLQIAQRAKRDSQTSPFCFQVAPAFNLNQGGLDLNLQKPDDRILGQRFPPFPQAFGPQKDVSNAFSEQIKAREDWHREVSDLLGSNQP